MSDYPENWSEIAEQIKVAYGWRCVCCHHPHETPTNRVACDEQCTHPQDDRQRMLTVHHLDEDKSNSAWWNLVPLCQVCHLRVQCRTYPQPTLFVTGGWLDIYIAGRFALELGFPDDIDFVARYQNEILTALVSQ